MFCKSPICFWLIPLSSSIINAWATCTMFLVSSLMKLLFYPSSFFYVYASSMEYISQLGKGYHIAVFPLLSLSHCWLPNNEWPSHALCFSLKYSPLTISPQSSLFTFAIATFFLSQLSASSLSSLLQ